MKKTFENLTISIFIVIISLTLSLMVINMPKFFSQFICWLGYCENSNLVNK